MKRKYLQLKILWALLCASSITGLTMVKANQNEVDSDVAETTLENSELLNRFQEFLDDTDSELEAYVQSVATTLSLDQNTALSYIYQNISSLANSKQISADIVRMLCQLKYQDTTLPSNMGTNWTLTDYSNYLNTEEGQRQLQLCNIYGMDPHLLFALEKVESNLDHYNHIGTYDVNGKYLFAVGITQQERANFYSVNASAEEIASKPPRTGYNYETNQIDSIPLCEDQLNDFDTNVKLGIMALNGALGLSDYDISYALDIYNKGKVGADRFREQGIVSGSPVYVSSVYQNIVVPYFVFQTSPQEMMIVDLNTNQKLHCSLLTNDVLKPYCDEYLSFLTQLNEQKISQDMIDTEVQKSLTK